MSRNWKFIIVACAAFIGGLLTHAKIYAKVPQEYTKPRSKKILIGKASWYSKESPGINHRTANNEVFDDNAMTCAMWEVPFDQRIKVTNLQNGLSVVVRVNDRGPHKRYFRKGRVVDLTKEAFDKIGGLNEGLIHVELEFL